MTRPKNENVRMIAYRISEDLIQRIEAYADMRARLDGRPCDRSTAIRLLLEKALAPPAAEVIEGVSEALTGKITDAFEPSPAPKKKQPPHRRQDRDPGVAFNQATERLKEEEER